jgi:cytochrome c oxidase subunit 2
LIIYYNLTYFDISRKWQVLFQDPGTPLMEGIVDFHHDLMFLIIFIVVFVLYVMTIIVYNFKETNYNKTNVILRGTHNTTLEVFWTILPSLLLLSVAIPSIALLYSIDELITPSVTLKVVGHQWYWTYEYSDFSMNYNHLHLESYMITDEDLLPGYYRLLETTSRVVLPTKVHIRVLITSADVLHCWAVPSLGIKTDACPGRLNQLALYIKRNGIFYGQCSEICGVNHGFMPIVVESVNLLKYSKWFSEQINKNIFFNF